MIKKKNINEGLVTRRWPGSTFSIMRMQNADLKKLEINRENSPKDILRGRKWKKK